METIQTINKWAVTLKCGQWIRPQENEIFHIHLCGYVVRDGKTVRIITNSVRKCRQGIVTTKSDHQYQLGEPDEQFANLILGGKLGAAKNFEYIIRKKTGELFEEGLIDINAGKNERRDD
jgi:hypothetical protein